MVVYTGPQSTATAELERLRVELERVKRKLESKKRVFARFSKSTSEAYDELEKEYATLNKEHGLVLTALKGLAGAFLSKFGLNESPVFRRLDRVAVHDSFFNFFAVQVQIMSKARIHSSLWTVSSIASGLSPVT
jgi:hypothetical protein